MDIHFDGFQHSIPTFWMILLILGVLGLSYWSYWRTEGLSNAFRWFLSGLRAAAFLILLLLLLNPVITTSDYETYPLQIALLLDNSQSTSIEKGDYHGLESYGEVLEQIKEIEDGQYDHLNIVPYGFDSELFNIESPAELNFEGSRTNIDQALADLLDIIDREEAVILVTDGIVTTGRDPSATANRFQMPIYTVGIGDTTRRNDLIVQSVTHNPTASLNSRLPVEASIRNDGFPDQDIPVQLMQNGAVLDETTIRSSEPRSVQQVRFEIALEEEGLQQYSIHVPEVEGEWTTENNTRFFSVDVRDDRIQILHLAYEIHPDVRNVRTFLQEDQQINLDFRTWTGDDRYVEGDLPDRPDTLDLVIFHGFPHTDLSSTHAGEVADRFSDNAILIMGSPGQDVTRLSSLFPGQLPLHFQSGFSWHNTQVAIAGSHDNHAILDFESPDDLRTTPIRSGIDGVSEQGNSTALLQTVYRGNPTGAPILAVRTLANRQVSHLNGYNFYRWALGTRDETRYFWENLLNNTVKWTAASPDEELLELVPAEPVFQIGEPLVMNGYFRNESGEPEANGVIELEIESSETGSSSYVMSNEGGGHYQLEISNLPEGTYTYHGIASRSNREVDARSGQFTIGGVNRELINTNRNDPLLQQLAGISGGTYLPHYDAHLLTDLLEQELGFEERVETISQSLSLHRHPIWFIVLILILALEWSLRKYRSLA